MSSAFDSLDNGARNMAVALRNGAEAVGSHEAPLSDENVLIARSHVKQIFVGQIDKSPEPVITGKLGDALRDR
jgi:hypothetical protein